jgi:hypothetical protein
VRRFDGLKRRPRKAETEARLSGSGKSALGLPVAGGSRDGVAPVTGGRIASIQRLGPLGELGLNGTYPGSLS